MAFQKKTWKDRLVEFAGRRKLTRVSGSIDSQIIVDVTREEGTVSQVGDAFAGANMNDLENRIEEGFKGTVDKDNILETTEELEANTEKGYLADALLVKGLNDSLGGLSFYEDEDGNKYVVGADAVPKKLVSGDSIISTVTINGNSSGGGTHITFTIKNKNTGKTLYNVSASNNQTSPQTLTYTYVPD